jgi:hypothetical protein
LWTFSTAVDNAAVAVADAVIEKYAEEFPEEPKMLRTRDPGHCIDLVAKDSAKLKCFVVLLSQTKSMIKFLSVDRIAADIMDGVTAKNSITEVLTLIGPDLW